MIYDDIEKIGHHFYDNFFKFSKDHFDWRLETSEESLIEAFKLKYDFGALNSSEKTWDRHWPLPRILAGLNTNSDEDVVSNNAMFMKYEQHPLHFTFEHVERQSNLRFGRTYFLSNCSTDYLKGINQNDETQIDNKQG